MKHLAKGTGTVVVMPKHAIDKNVKAIEKRRHLIKISGVLACWGIQSSKINNGYAFATIHKLYLFPSV